MKQQDSSTDKINLTMLTLAREARGLSQVELAEKLEMSQSNIGRWESGSIEISRDILQQLVKVLQYPESFFYQEGQVLPPAFYRKRDKVSQKLLNAIDADINICRLSTFKLLQATGYVPAKLSGIHERGASPQQTAQALRKNWKSPRGPLSNLTQLMEANGILIMALDFATERVDSRSILSPAGHPLVFTNKLLLGDRLRFTLAYELGLLLMHAGSMPGLGIDIGHEANLFAAELLMPEKDIAADFARGVSLQHLFELKLKWKVSMQALLYRAEDIGFLTANQKRYLVGQFNALKIRRREPPELDIPKEQPTLLRDLLTRYKSAQRMSVKEMAMFMNLTPEEFSKKYAGA